MTGPMNARVKTMQSHLNYAQLKIQHLKDDVIQKNQRLEANMTEFNVKTMTDEVLEMLKISPKAQNFDFAIDIPREITNLVGEKSRI